MNKASQSPNRLSRVRNKALALGMVGSLTLGAAAANAMPAEHGEDTPSKVRGQTHYLASRIAARILNLPDRKTTNIGGLRLVEAKVDNERSLDPNADGVYWFDAAFHVDKDKKIRPKGIVRLFISEGQEPDKGDFAYLASAYLENTGKGWLFEGEYESRKGDGITLRAATDPQNHPDSVRMTARRSYEIAEHMNDIVGMAVEGKPTDILPPPFQG